MENLLCESAMASNSPISMIYLNNAATSFPKAPGLGEEVASLITTCPRHSERSGATGENILLNCRKEIAKLLNTKDPNRIVLCSSSTIALNIAINGFDLQGATVLTTALEHNSVLRPLYRLEQLNKIRLVIVKCTKEGRVNEIEWQRLILKHSPRLVILNHASNVTGAVNDAQKLLGYAHKNGATTILDASQTIGIIPIDTQLIPADMIAFTGHKYLLGPSGTGGLYVHKDLSLEPFLVGGTGIRSDLKTMPPEMPQKLEAGTPSIPLFGGLLFAIKWAALHPEHQPTLSKHLVNLENGLQSLGAHLIHVNGCRTFVVSFQFPGWVNEEVGYILDKCYSIICRVGLHCAPLIHRYIGSGRKGTVRFSLSRFTSEDDINTTLEAMSGFQK